MESRSTQDAFERGFFCWGIRGSLCTSALKHIRHSSPNTTPRSWRAELTQQRAAYGSTPGASGTVA